MRIMLQRLETQLLLVPVTRAEPDLKPGWVGADRHGTRVARGQRAGVRQQLRGGGGACSGRGTSSEEGHGRSALRYQSVWAAPASGRPSWLAETRHTGSVTGGHKVRSQSPARWGRDRAQHGHTSYALIPHTHTDTHVQVHVQSYTIRRTQ